MNAKFLLILGLILCGGAVYALHSDMTKTVEVCKDARLYMEGGTDVQITARGLSSRHEIKVFKRMNNKDVFLAKYVVSSETPSNSVQKRFVAQNVTLEIYGNQKPHDYGYPSRISTVGQDGKSTSVDLFCSSQKL